MSVTLNYSEREIVQALVMVAVAVANGATVESVCREKGISTEQYFEWANRYGNIDLSRLTVVESLRPLWVKELWHEYREVFKAIIGETIVTAIVILILIVWDYLLGNIREDKREVLDTIHYYISIGIIVIFGGSSILKMLILAIRSIQAIWRRK